MGDDGRYMVYNNYDGVLLVRLQHLPRCDGDLLAGGADLIFQRCAAFTGAHASMIGIPIS